MNRILKAACVLAVVFFVAITIGSVADHAVYAGGGTDYTVTVSNPTDSTCKVVVYVLEMAQSRLEEVTIQPGGSHTWHAGAWCPSGLLGEYYDKVGNAWRKMQCCNPYGTRASCEGDSLYGFVAVCKSVRFKVCRKAGEKGVQDYDFGFCKE